MQTWHADPAAPQAPAAFDGVMQAPLGAQQPVQLAEQLPVPAEQTPALQVSLAEQDVQTPPPVPQAAAVLPALQMPSDPQQPLH